MPVIRMIKSNQMKEGQMDGDVTHMAEMRHAYKILG
jgi:hypothetical protein